MKLPRFRLRTLMIAVAVVGLLLGAIPLIFRSLEYRSRAANHASIAGNLDKRARARPGGAARAELDERRAAYHDGLRLKYEHAARNPWLPVESDPPVPD